MKPLLTEIRTNRGYDKQEEADTLILTSTTHTQILYQIFYSNGS